MPGGFLQGLLGGLAGGFADATWEKHQQDIAQDLARRKFLVDAISDFTKSPNFRSESLPIALDHIDALFGVKPGTGKKGEQKTSDILKSFAGMLNSLPMPGVAQAEGIPATPRQETPEGITAVPGGAASGLPPLPELRAGMFRSNDEMAQEALNKQKPILDYKSKIDAENDQRKQERQLAVEREKSKNRAALRQSDWAERYKYLDAREQARAERDVEKVKATLDPALSDETRDTIARQRVERDLDEVHKKRVLEIDKLTQGITESKARVGRIALLNARTGQVMSKAELEAGGMNVNVYPFETAKANAAKYFADAEFMASQGKVAEAEDFRAKGEAELMKARGLAKSLEQRYPGRVKAYVDQDAPAVVVGGGGSGLPPVPQSTKSISTIQYQKMVTDLGKDVADATLKRRGVIVRD